MSGLASEFRFVLRRLRRAPAFTAIAVLTLALGIGATTAIYSVVDAVLIRALPFPDPGRLVYSGFSALGADVPRVGHSDATYLLYRSDNRVFEDIAVSASRQVSLTGDGSPERLRARLVTDGWFGVLGVKPALGRAFTAEDVRPGAPQTLVLSWQFWRQRFGGDRGVIGKTVRLDGQTSQIIGIMPRGFRLNDDPQVWVPAQFDAAQTSSGSFNYDGIARLRPGVSMTQAQADMERVLPALPDRYPGPISRAMMESAKLAPVIHPLKQEVTGDVSRVLWILLGTVSIVLLVACANVANLVLVRAEGRQREVALRTAIGAGRRHIAGQFLLESFTLALLGGALGVVLARVGIRAFASLGGDLPRMQEITINGRILVFAAAVSVLCGLFFGAFPIMRHARPRLSAALKEGGRGSSAGRERHRARNSLVVAQVSLALVLMAGAGLMVRSFLALRHVDPGFRAPEQIITTRVAIPTAEIADATAVANAYEQILAGITQLPGVVAAGATSSVPMEDEESQSGTWIEDHPTADGGVPPIVRTKWVLGDYFGTLGLSLRAGRALTAADLHSHARLVVVNEALARQFWGSPEKAMGRRLRQDPTDEWYTVVGVVADEHDAGLDQDAPGLAYFPLLQEDRGQQSAGLTVERSLTYVVRTRGLPAALLPELRKAVWSVNPNLPLANTRTLQEIVDKSMARTALTMTLLAIAAFVGLFLGAIGLYGVMAYIVAQRTREIGVRMALGAETRRVAGMVLGQGLTLAGMGVAIGMACALALTRLMSTLLFGVHAFDPITFGAVALILVAVAGLASYTPARRAATLDPLTALRIE